MRIDRSALAGAFRETAERERIPACQVENLVLMAKPIYEEVHRRFSRAAGSIVAGICGAQGSGKTTVAAGLKRALEDDGFAVAALSLDDLYLSRAERERIAAAVHPLFSTRGVPGTHDVERGISVIESLTSARPDQITSLPAFDKASDEPLPREREPSFRGRADIVLIEGWCLGARPQEAHELVQPLNRLERDQDPQGIWRAHVNAELAGRYRQLFDRLDMLALLRAPGFEQVWRWRAQQEQKLADHLRASGRTLEGSRVMDAPELENFIMHYERLTRHILNEMPGRADVVIDLDEDRRPAIAA